MDTYIQPTFLEGNSVDEIHQRMLDCLPSGIEKTENSIPWDFTRPAATLKAEFIDFHLNETIKLIFPQWSYGAWLDYHGQLHNIIRKSANTASGWVRVTGTAGTEIPTGFQFATPANTSSISASTLFSVVEGGVLEGEKDASGKVSTLFEVEALLGGTLGNVAEDTVKLMVAPLSGISYITNDAPISGGTPEEDDDSLKERILEAIRSGISYTGCNADYSRWAKEVAGVGNVIVDPEWSDPTMPDAFHYTDHYGVSRCAGAVRLIIVDENGQPANEQILEAVQLHVCGKDERDLARLAPIGAKVTVVAPEPLYLDLSGTLFLEEDVTLDSIIPRIRENLAIYWLSVAEDAQTSELGVGTVYWVQVGAVIAKTEGVVDYQNLTINGTTGNYFVTQAEFPTTGEVYFDVVN